MPGFRLTLKTANSPFSKPCSVQSSVGSKLGCPCLPGRGGETAVWMRGRSRTRGKSRTRGPQAFTTGWRETLPVFPLTAPMLPPPGGPFPAIRFRLVAPAGARGARLVLPAGVEPPRRRRRCRRLDLCEGPRPRPAVPRCSGA